jgi:hypothetical protein
VFGEDALRGFLYAKCCLYVYGGYLGSMAFYAHATGAVGEVFRGMHRFVDGGGIRAGERAAAWRVCGTAQSRRWRRIVGGRVDAVLAVHLFLDLVRC